MNIGPTRTDLHFTDGWKSDKVYNAEIQEINGEYQVEFEYGKRGSNLNVYRKPESPTTYGKAHNIYVQQLEKKIKKGYEITYIE